MRLAAFQLSKSFFIRRVAAKSIAALLLSLFLATAWTVLADSISLDGDWSGILNTSTGEQYLTLHVTQEMTGALAVSLEGISSSDWNYPGRGTLRGRLVNFQIFIAGGTYQGTLSADGRKMRGIWTQGAPFPLELTREPGAGEPAKTFEATPTPDPAMPPVTLADLKPILDREMEPVIDHGLLSPASGGGVVVGVLDHGARRIFSYGSAHPDSIFEIASITKTFTGLALAQMVAQNKVTLDQPVQSLLADSSIGEARGAEITLLDLAIHRSGLPSDPDNLRPSNPQNPYADYDDTRLLEFIGKHGLKKPVGADYLYCNFGYGLLGYALGRRAGVSYEELVKNANHPTAPTGRHGSYPLT